MRVVVSRLEQWNWLQSFGGLAIAIAKCGGRGVSFCSERFCRLVADLQFAEQQRNNKIMSRGTSVHRERDSNVTNDMDLSKLFFQSNVAPALHRTIHSNRRCSIEPHGRSILESQGPSTSFAI